MVKPCATAACTALPDDKLIAFGAPLFLTLSFPIFSENLGLIPPFVYKSFPLLHIFQVSEA